MIRFCESDIEFQFNQNVRVIKFDDCSYYRNHFQRLQGSKAIDFFVYDESSRTIYFIEVKNFWGVEKLHKNRLKVSTNHSLGLEVAQKV